MSRQELAQRTGLSEAELEALEYGDRRASAGELWQFCKLFDVRPSFFFTALVRGNQSSPDD